jgi:hypothetical protein
LRRSPDLEWQLADLRERGYVEAHEEISAYFYRNPELLSKYGKFSTGDIYGNHKRVNFHTTSEIFGKNLVSYYYDLTRKEELEKHLEELFRFRNGSGSTSLLQSFTRILHENHLHWNGCYDKKGPVNKNDSKLGKARPRLTKEQIEKMKKALDSS